MAFLAPNGIAKELIASLVRASEEPNRLDSLVPRGVISAEETNVQDDRIEFGSHFVSGGLVIALSVAGMCMRLYGNNKVLGFRGLCGLLMAITSSYIHLNGSRRGLELNEGENNGMKENESKVTYDGDEWEPSHEEPIECEERADKVQTTTTTTVNNSNHDRTSQMWRSELKIQL